MGHYDNAWVKIPLQQFMDIMDIGESHKEICEYMKGEIEGIRKENIRLVNIINRPEPEGLDDE